MEGRKQEASAMVLRQLGRRWGPLAPATEASINKLPLEQLELLGDDLLDFKSPADLSEWFAQQS